MKKLFSKLNEELKSGRNAVLCSILASSGSSPRGSGAKMLVCEDGSSMGTVGGGAVELQAQTLAKNALKEKKSAVQGFILRPNEVADIGMICGGNVTVYIQYFSCEDAKLCAFVEAARDILEKGNDNAWLVMKLSGAELMDTGLYTSGEGLKYMQAVPEDVLGDIIKNRAVYRKGEIAYYAEPIVQKGRVYIFGGGHVGKALTPVLAKVGFNVTVFDNRPAFAKVENFPGAEKVILGDYRNIYEKISLAPEDYVVIMTPGHQADYEVLEQALRSPTKYIGCIGSRHKVAATREKLFAAGISEADADRVHSPIGLAIGAETPEEIAISIAAQMIAVRSGCAK